MGIPVIKIPFNQITDSRAICGYPPAYKDGKPGLLGRMAQKEVGSLQCIVILDEFDKPGHEGAYVPFYNLFDGQQRAWDEYYETFYDTSGIMFFCTANSLSQIPHSLLDRCQIIEVGAYTCREQAEIAREVIIPRLSAELGIKKKVLISDSVLRSFVKKFVMSGGIRELEEKMDCVLKRMSRRGGRLNITENIIKECLGEPITEHEDADDMRPGIITALAVNTNGGSTFRVIAYGNPHGSEELMITGLAEGSMAESFQYAFSTAQRLLGKKIRHLAIHMESAGIRKDGPSCGVGVLTSIISHEIGVGVGSIAITGELSPTGKVLPVGGLRDKLIAAEKSGIEKVFLPKDNFNRMKFAGGLDSFELEIIPIENVNELLRTVFPLHEFADIS